MKISLEPDHADFELEEFVKRLLRPWFEKALLTSDCFPQDQSPRFPLQKLNSQSSFEP